MFSNLHTVNIVRMNPYLFIVLRVIETLAGIGISVAVNMIIKNPDKKIVGQYNLMKGKIYNADL